VMDGERGNEYRRRLLPTYKANRKRFVPLTSTSRWSSSKNKDVDLREALPYIEAFLWECNVPVVKIEYAEADDVVATLVDQVLQTGLKTIITSPDKDFKQLISKNVQLVMPMPEFGRWSFYSIFPSPSPLFRRSNSDNSLEDINTLILRTSPPCEGFR